MSLLNQMIRGGLECEAPRAYAPEGMKNALARPRTFRETIADLIAYHEAKIKDLQAVRDSLTPEVETFVEAIQKLG